MSPFHKSNRNFPAHIKVALTSVNSFVALHDPAQVNYPRFESCRKQILGLPLRKSEIDLMRRLLDKTERYLRYGESGAVKFELNLIAKILSQKLT